MLEQLVLREIQLQRAKRVGINVSDDMLNEALSRVATNLGYTLEELPTVLAAQNIDYALYREDSRQDMIIEQLQQRDVINRISITPRELDQCLANADVNAANAFDYNISHILISVPANATAQDIEKAKQRIDEIHSRLDSGEDFARLAVATSHAQTALDGGSLGWRKGSQLPTLFKDIVLRLKPGQYSDPIQSGSGFQIVKLNEMRGAERTMVDQLHVRHILLRPNEILDDAAVRQKLLGIRAQIVGGADFGTVARAVSEDTASATDGGDLGWLSPGDTAPEFEQAIARLARCRKSASRSSRATAGTWSKCSSVARTTSPTRRNARTAPARFARPRPRKSASYGCGGCATRRSSIYVTERPPRAPAYRRPIVSTPLPLVVVSSGEPAGIGPDIALALGSRAFAARLAVLGDPTLLASPQPLARSRRATPRARERRGRRTALDGQPADIARAAQGPRPCRAARHGQRGVRARHAARAPPSCASRAPRARWSPHRCRRA